MTSTEKYQLRGMLLALAGTCLLYGIYDSMTDSHIVTQLLSYGMFAVFVVAAVFVRRYPAASFWISGLAATHAVFVYVTVFQEPAGIYIMTVGIVLLYRNSEGFLLRVLYFIYLTLLILLSAAFTSILWIEIVMPLISLYTLWGMVEILVRTRRREGEQVRIRLENTLDASIFTLAHQAELRDMNTGNHLERTRLFTRTLAHHLVDMGMYLAILNQRYITNLERGAILHDIGKIAIPDSILLKPAALSEDEFREIQKHTVIGEGTIEFARKRLPFDSFFTLAKEITRHHHERWDGTGYPDRLSQETIPLSARILALADVYDALRSNRPYKTALSHEETVKILEENCPGHFDPLVLRAFRVCHTDFARIYDAWTDF